MYVYIMFGTRKSLTTNVIRSLLCIFLSTYMLYARMFFRVLILYVCVSWFFCVFFVVVAVVVSNIYKGFNTEVFASLSCMQFSLHMLLHK